MPSLSKSVLLIIAIISGNTGCHEPAGINQFADGQELPILNQVQGTHSNETRAMQLVIRDTATLSKVPIVDVPVDFNDQMLLIVTLARMTSEQYSVRIDGVWRDGHEIQVATTVKSPRPGVPIVMSSPYCIAVVPRSDLNISGFLPEPPTRARTWSQSAPPSSWDKQE